MDIEKLIEQLNARGLSNGSSLGYHCGLYDDAATALSTLQAENAQLRADLEYEREHADAYHEECGQWEAENEKLRAELESKEKYYEQMIDALSAADSADLAQMTACVYYKPGGLCRYGGDDPANVCVLGPCPHERTAEEVLADLARVTAERNAAQALLAERSGVTGSAPITTAFGIPLERIRELVEADREGRVRIIAGPKPKEDVCGNCGNFIRIPGTRTGVCREQSFYRNQYGKEEPKRGTFSPSQSRKACRKFVRVEAALKAREQDE